MLRRTLLKSALAAGVVLPGVAGRVPRVSGQSATPCPAGTPEANAALARRFLEEAVNGRDLSRFDAILAPDVVYHAAATSQSTTADDVKNTYQAGLDGFSDLTFTILETVADGDMVAYPFSATGTNDGAFRGNPATNKSVTWTGILLFRIACGRIVEAWNAIDQIGRAQQLGLLPTAPTAAPPASESAATPATCATSDRAAVEGAVRTWWEKGWNAGDPDALAAIVDPGFVHHWASGPDTRGLPATVEKIAQWRAAMPDLTIRFDRILVEDGLAAGLWTATGTDTGGVMGNPPTGKTATWTGINLFRADCGTITEVWSEMDTTGMLDQLGLKPGGAPAATPTS